MVDISKLSQEDIDAWYESQEAKKEQPVPTAEEEEEISKKFKKTVNPRILTPEQAKAEGPQNKPYNEPIGQPSDQLQARQEPQHETIQISRTPHISDWKEDVYEVVVSKTYMQDGVDRFHKDKDGNPMTRRFLVVEFETGDGRTINRQMSLNRNKGTVLNDLLSVIWGEPPEDISTDDLRGKNVRITVKNEPNERGDIWPRVKEFLPSLTQFKAGGG
jgi:hypothetical protein